MSIKNYSQVCLWPGTILNPGDEAMFENWFLSEMNTRVKYLEQVTTLPTPGIEGTGGRIDLIFAVHDEDVAHFVIPRINHGIRWIDDVKLNEEPGRSIYNWDDLDHYLSWEPK